MRWIIGDIHGMLRPLERLLEAIGKADGEAQLLFAGDYVNRGPDSRGVIDLLLTLGNARFVHGNHDDIFDQVLHGQSYAENASRADRIAAFQWFMRYGLEATFVSYGGDVAYLQYLAEHPTAEGLDALGQWVPESHRQFIQQLLPAIEFEDAFIVHGKWDPDELSEGPGILERLKAHPKRRHQLLWGRFTSEEIFRTKAWRRTGYFGHTPVSHYAPLPEGMVKGARSKKGEGDEMVPIVGNRMILIDTAAALGVSGRLTAYCPDNHQIIQTTHFGQLVAAHATS